MKRTWSLADHIRMNAYPEPNSGCWLWGGSIASGGYGVVRFGSIKTSRRESRAHRVSYEAFIGPIGDGLVVCHRCDNPPCVNPDHLFLGTKADNAADMVAKGRWRTGFHGGTASGLARLSEPDVPAIRAMRDTGASQRAIASRFGVTQGTISRVLAGKAWTHV